MGTRLVILAFAGGETAGAPQRDADGFEQQFPVVIGEIHEAAVVVGGRFVRSGDGQQGKIAACDEGHQHLHEHGLRGVYTLFEDPEVRRDAAGACGTEIN